MKPILVHIHVFYTEQWPDLYALLTSLCEYDFDVWVTHCGNRQDFENLVLSDVSSAHVLQVPNAGYDIGPFVAVLKQVNLVDYSYCIKLHTKRDLPVNSMLGPYDVSGGAWRHCLLSFMKGPGFKMCLESFAADEKLGMVGHHALIWQREPSDKKVWRQAVQLLESAGLRYRNPAYVAGSMFMCRAILLRPLVKILGESCFGTTERKDSSSLAHVAERLLGFVITAQGYTVRDVYTPAKERFVFRLRGMSKQVLRFLYQRKITRKGKLVIKICRIPVYRATPGKL